MNDEQVKCGCIAKSDCDGDTYFDPSACRLHKAVAEIKTSLSHASMWQMALSAVPMKNYWKGKIDAYRDSLRALGVEATDEPTR